MPAPLYMLCIEVDGHLRGGPPLRPSAARIDGINGSGGFLRTLIRPLNDWRGARHTMAGRVYGVVAMFPLREGHMYEVLRPRGRARHRELVAVYYYVDEGGAHERTEKEAILWAEQLRRSASATLKPVSLTPPASASPGRSIPSVEST